MIRLNQVKLPLNYNEADLEDKIIKLLKLTSKDLVKVLVVKRSIDARKKEDIHYSLSVDVITDLPDEKKIVSKLKNKDIFLSEPVLYHFPSANLHKEQHIAVIGSGPAGLFCSLFLCRAGLAVDLYERGHCVEERTKAVQLFWNGGILDPNTNVQFGEGGAGTFSDGKLNTGIKDKTGRIRKVLETFVEFGADPSILYENKPHIGTDVLAKVVTAMREEILRLGGRIHFDSCVTDFILQNGRICGLEINHEKEVAADLVVLAIGHSARDTFSCLQKHEVPMEAKAFAVGCRLEHDQHLIDRNAYGTLTQPLPAADYKVTARARNGRGVFSFCMCPGGYVVNASSEPGMICVNGMSYSGRNGNNANSAIVVTVEPSDFGSSDVLGGMEFQRRLERAAYRVGDGLIPFQRNEDFKKGMPTREIGKLIPQFKGEGRPADLREVLPEFVAESIVDGMISFDKMIKGFDDPEAVFSGIESRTSSPVRILRNEKLESEGVIGLYPCGEGAGYAGGITSAAVDGIKVAEAIATRI